MLKPDISANVQNYQDRYSSDYSGKANPLIIKFSFEPSTVIATLTKPGMSPQIIDFEGISRFLILSTDKVFVHFIFGDTLTTLQLFSKPDLKVNYTVKYEGCMEHILTFDPIKAEYFEVFVTGWTC